jgi:hypothetical protein
MGNRQHSALGDWRIETSYSRFLPPKAGLSLESVGDGFALAVTWKDADQLATLRRSGGKLDPAQGRAEMSFATADGEHHRFIAAVHVGTKRRRLFGFVVSGDEREETGTGAWTAIEEDPVDESATACDSASPGGALGS